MFKKLLSLAMSAAMVLSMIPATVLAAGGDVAVTKENFPDANFLAYVKTLAGAEDDVLTGAEIAKITQIDCSDKKIGSLVGVEHFTALEWLFAQNNDLQALDVTHNSNLKHLHVTANDLQTLDVSHNPELQDLSCSQNHLNSLDVSQNSKLEHLECELNFLMELNVSQNPGLVSLYCGDNQLFDLDVSHNPKLVTLYCEQNKLKNLNLFGNSELKELKCELNQIEHINLPPDSTLDVSQVWQADHVDHWHTLQSDAKEDHTWSEWSDNGDGTKTHHCEVCKLYETIDSDHQHQFSEHWTGDGESHWHECSCGERSDYAPHTWSEWTVTKEPTETDKGMETRSCFCGATQSRAIPAKKPGESLAVDDKTFPDAKFLAYVKTLPGAEDGKLTDAEIAKITRIACSDIGIKSVAGVEHFTALTTLECYGCSLTSLDVSHNTKLTDLAIGNGYGESPSDGNNSLTTLNVSHNPELTRLDCRGNGLTKLDVSKNSKLSNLNAGNNRLTTLDLSHNPALTNLEVDGNQLTTLDVSHNPELTALNCGGNQLTALDVSHNLKLSNLNCSVNQLTELNVSKNPELVQLDCGGNRLARLDLSKNTKLQYLSCGGNQLTEVKLASGSSVDPSGEWQYNGEQHWHVGMNDAVGHNWSEWQVVKEPTATADGLRTHYCYTCYQEGEEIIPAEKPVHSLAVDSKTFSDAKFLAYVKTLPGAEDGKLTDAEIAKITEINCSQKEIKSLAGVEHFTALTRLDAHANAELTSVDVSALSQLTELNFFNCSLTALDVTHNPKLSILNVGSQDPEFNDYGTNALTTLDVSQNPELTDLDCYRNDLTKIDVTHNPKLRELSVGSNRLTTLNVSQNPELERLDTVSYGTDVKLKKLDVTHNPKLKTLEVSDNELTELDLSQNHELVRMLVNNNQLTELDVTAMPELDELYCYSNRLSSLDVTHNSKLTALDCSENRLSSLDLTHNTQLTNLNCVGNQLTEVKLPSGSTLDPSQGWQHNGEQHWHYGKNDAASHEWGEWQVEKEPTATTDGVRARYCSTCYRWERETIPTDKPAVAVDSTNFPDAKFLAVMRNQPGAEDGTLTAEEVAQITRLICYEQEIKDLTGVELLTSLTFLDCAYNELTELDVSKNTKLVELYCRGNQLTELDVSHNPELTDLHCTENQLTRLDVSHNHKLVNLDCSNNRLETLIVGPEVAALAAEGASALTTLNCANNRLTRLDLSQAPALTTLDCSGNQLTEVQLPADSPVADQLDESWQHNDRQHWHAAKNDAADHTWGAWTENEDGKTQTHTCTVCGHAQTENIPDEKPGYTLTGAVTSAGKGTVTIKVFVAGAGVPSYTTETTGTSYTIKGVKAGSYTVEVSKDRHVTRTYEVTVNSNTTLDVTIRLLGDVTQDGKVDTRDWTRLYKHVSGLSPLEGYALECADTNVDQKVDTRDWTRLYKHINGLQPLW